MMISASEQGELIFHSPLFIATMLDNLELVKELVEKGENPLDRDENNRTLMHFAAAQGRLKILRYLVDDRGCNPATGGSDNCDVLHIAVINGQIEVVKYLINQCKVDPSELDNLNNSALTYACYNGDIETATLLVKKMEDMTKEDIFYCDGTGENHFIRNPLCGACSAGELPLVKYLIEECGCDPARAESGHDFKTPLMVAIASNHSHIVKYLAKLKVPSPPASTNALHIAVEKQNLGMVKHLTRYFSCNPNSKHSTLSLTPLHVAAREGNLGIVKYLITKLKCDPSINGGCGVQPVHSAATRGHVHILKYLIEVHGCNPSAIDEYGETPLYVAADRGHLPVFRYLALEHGCNPHQVIYNSTTIFHRAALQGHLDIIKFFIFELKCDFNYKGVFGGNLLHYAAFGGHLDTVKYLIDVVGFDPLFKDDKKRTALHNAALQGSLSLLKYLIGKKCDPYDTDTDNRNAIIHAAAENGNVRIVQYFIEELGVDKNYQDPVLGYSLLSLAAQRGHLPVVLYLLKIGSNLCDGQLLSPLDHAANGGQLIIVEHLMSHYPEMYKSSKKTHFPLFHAAVSGHLQVLRYFIDKTNIFLNEYHKERLLLAVVSSGNLDIAKYLICDVHLDPSSLTSLLHNACYHGHVEIAKYLITELNFDPNVDVSGMLKTKPIHLAARMGHLCVLKYLLEEIECDVNSVNFFGHTPLFFAVCGSHLTIIQYLIEHNADPFPRDIRGNTPLHYAAFGNHFEIVKFYDRLELINYPSLITNNFMDTPLHLALQNHSLITALYLIVKIFNCEKQ